MSTSPGSQYFVRVRGRVQGPYEVSRLKVLRARGQFSRVFEVSEDGQNWVSSETLSELIDPASMAPMAREEAVVSRGHSAVPSVSTAAGRPDPPRDDWEPRRRKKSESNLGTILLIVLLVIVPAGIVGGILLLQRLEQDRAAGPADAVADSGPEERAPVTFKYWLQFKAARNTLNWTQEATAHEIMTKLRTAAEAMAEIPTLGVDPDAVLLAVDYSTALRHVASAIDTAGDPKTYLEALTRGTLGEPFGKVQEMKVSNDAALQELGEVEQRTTRVRATLTSAYARQFP